MTRARMVDVSGKPESLREAVARGRIILKPETVRLIREKRVEKGDVESVASVAAILAVKKTPELIPLCHPIPILHVRVDFDYGEDYVEVTVAVKSKSETGVEMEALAGVVAALLSVWDMVKKYEKDEKGQYPITRIQDVRVEYKAKSALKEEV